MEYGHFKNGGKTYEINNVKTPTPWKNTLFNDEYFMEVSQRLCGQSFAVDNYKRSPSLDNDKRFYVKINDKIYHLGSGESDKFACEHHIHKSVMIEEFDSFISRITVFVPVRGKQEIWNIEIENKTNEKIAPQVFACFDFANIGYLSLECDYLNECFVKTSFPYHIKYEEYEQLKPTERKIYVTSNKKVKSYECSRDRYFGGDNPFSTPVMIENGEGSNKKCEYEYCIAGFHHELVLEANKSDSITYVAGETKNFEEIVEIKNNLPDFETELKKAEEKWNKDTSSFMINTEYEDLNTLVNYWLKKQVTFLTRHNRGGVYCPVRNQLQDAMGYATINPDEALEFALRVLRRQHEDGYLKQWYMTDGSPDIGLCLINHSDACVWLIICMIEIIKLTGDESLYQRLEGYMDSDAKEPIIVHLKKAAHYMSTQLGQHGLCLMKDGDWTDPINGVGRLGRGESTWNTLALIYAIKLLNEIEFDKELDEIRNQLINAVNTHCWNEDRYIAGFDDDGKPFGCKGEKEASLFLNAQTWALFAGVCDEERTKIVRKTIDKLKTDFGFLLLDPPFETWNPRWGKISIKQKGNTENGSVYSHGNLFKAYADFYVNDNQAGIDTILSILPTNPKNPPCKNLQVPTFVPNYYFGCKGDNFGHSSTVYGSGAAGWILWLAQKYLK